VSNDPALVKQQYRDGSNLDARIALHARFSTATRGFHDWLFDFVVAPPDARLLELGCGTGQMWGTIRKRVPAAWRIVLTDFSFGMLTSVRARLGTTKVVTTGNKQVVTNSFVTERDAPVVTTEVVTQSDAQAIPFPADCFDLVFANHMLYHMPDLSRTLSEIRRVLKPGGQLIAATNGNEHMLELGTLADAFGLDFSLRPNLPFTLENGGVLLAPHFEFVARHDFVDALAVTEAEPLVAYILSMRMATGFFTPERTERLRALVADHIARDGVFHISKSAGIFVATN
jgi:SAM-dependent methyltransferase